VIAQLVIGVLGVLLFSGEYATGMIRPLWPSFPLGFLAGPSLSESRSASLARQL
jgi:hypothetical protein